MPPLPAEAAAREQVTMVPTPPKHSTYQASPKHALPAAILPRMSSGTQGDLAMVSSPNRTSILYQSRHESALICPRIFAQEAADSKVDSFMSQKR